VSDERTSAVDTLNAVLVQLDELRELVRVQIEDLGATALEPQPNDDVRPERQEDKADKISARRAERDAEKRRRAEALASGADPSSL
jgi:hypothetical protein